MSKGLEMLMGSIKGLIPASLWEQVEKGVVNVVGKVDDISTTMTKIQNDINRIEIEIANIDERLRRKDYTLTSKEMCNGPAQDITTANGHGGI